MNHATTNGVKGLSAFTAKTIFEPFVCPITGATTTAPAADRGPPSTRSATGTRGSTNMTESYFYQR
ncbi:MAG: hypothetical protein JWR37_149 [Mycobacterium sp.]|nr:hypothetical protein [Mycobacterium sp.]